MTELSKPKPKSTINPRVVQQQVSDIGRLSREIPDGVKIAMAGAIMAFSSLDVAAELFIWDIFGLNPDDGKLLTAMDSKDRFELAKKFSERYAIPIHEDAQKSADAWSLIRIIIEARNKMAHGVWSMIDGKTPVAVSFRIPTEQGTINSEHFSIDRMDEIQASCWKLKIAFDRMSKAAQTLPRTPPAQPPPTPSSPPEHPVGGGQ